ncbi:MAG TPA: hypothetical protein VHM91_15320, partial [Verrucomicrobiales bacterium]|nr:hypothetical protein [Verrucomicrobiales bacterium]
DEFDLSLRLLEIDMETFRSKIDALKKETFASERALKAKAREYDTYFEAALKYAETHGQTNPLSGGRVEFIHHPDAASPPPAPPPPFDLKLPELPSPPVPRLTAADVQKRQSELLKTLMKNSNPMDFLNDVKEAAAKIGVHCGR